MAKIKSSGRRDVSIPNASMSDIAFLLLLFFMVTTVFVRERVRVDRYQFPTATRNVRRISRGESATIYITVDGSIYIDDVKRDIDDDSSPGSIKNVMIEKAKDIPNMKVCIRTHRDTPYREVRSVMMRLQQANTRDVVFEAQKKL